MYNQYNEWTSLSPCPPPCKRRLVIIITIIGLTIFSLYHLQGVSWVTSPISSILRQKLPCARPLFALPAVSVTQYWISITKREWFKRLPISNDANLCNWPLVNEYWEAYTLRWVKNWSTFFSLLLETLEQNRMSRPKIWWPGVEWWVGVKKGGRGAGSGSHRNRFEQRVEILPLQLRSHALVCADIGHNKRQQFFHFYFLNDIIRVSAVPTMSLWCRLLEIF